MSFLRSEFLAEFDAKLEEPLIVGKTPHGIRIIFKIEGGTFIGPQIKGEVIPSGADWFIIRGDGTGELDVRATVHTDDDDIIYIYYRGILNNAKEVLKRRKNGLINDTSEYYLRTTPIFETGSKKYFWLNKIISVGFGELGSNSVKYKIYQIL
jgi:hypothetical protein